MAANINGFTVVLWPSIPPHGSHMDFLQAAPRRPHLHLDRHQGGHFYTGLHVSLDNLHHPHYILAMDLIDELVMELEDEVCATRGREQTTATTTRWWSWNTIWGGCIFKMSLWITSTFRLLVLVRVSFLALIWKLMDSFRPHLVLVSYIYNGNKSLFTIL